MILVLSNYPLKEHLKREAGDLNETLCEIYNIIDRLTRTKPNNLK